MVSWQTGAGSEQKCQAVLGWAELAAEPAPPQSILEARENTSHSSVGGQGAGLAKPAPKIRSRVQRTGLHWADLPCLPSVRSDTACSCFPTSSEALSTQGPVCGRSDFERLRGKQIPETEGGFLPQIANLL